MQQIAKERGFTIRQVEYEEGLDLSTSIKWVMKEVFTHEQLIDEFEDYCNEEDQDQLKKLLAMIDNAYNDLQQNHSSSAELAKAYKACRCLYSETGDGTRLRYRAVVAYFITMQVV